MTRDLTYFWRRIRFEISDRLSPTYFVKCTRGRFSVPGINRATVNLAAWRPSWKTKLIEAAYQRRPGAFVDVGANVGQTLLDHASIGLTNSYFGFEPNPQCLPVLDALVRVNRLASCYIVPVGLSDRNGVLRLYQQPGDEAGTGASTEADLRPGREWEISFVPCFRLDDIRDQINLAAISLVKIDVEGAEAAVLSGMTDTLSRTRPWIICEILHRDAEVAADTHQARLDRIEQHLKKIDYEAYRIVKTTDESQIIGFERSEHLPNKLFTAQNAHECDYLLIPPEDPLPLLV